MDEYKVKRSGRVALKVQGERVVEAGGRFHAGQECNRWYDLAVYRAAESGKIVVAASYETRWQGEESQYAAEVVGSMEEVPSAFDELEAELSVLTANYGYPPGDQYSDKQARMLAQLRAVWQSRVSAVCDELGIAEEV